MNPSEPEGACGRQGYSGPSLRNLDEFHCEGGFWTNLKIFSAFRCNQMGIGGDLSESG